MRLSSLWLVCFCLTQAAMAASAVLQEPSPSPLAKLDKVTRQCVSLDVKDAQQTIDYTADQSVLQADDGTIIFDLAGDKGVLQLKSNQSWTPSRWGRYQAWVYFQSNTKCKITAELGVPSFQATLTSTDNKTIAFHLGPVYIDEKKQEATVEIQTQGDGTASLHSLVLVPSIEKEDANLKFTLGKPILLHSNCSTVLGKKLRYEPKPEKNTLGFWVNTNDSAFWDFEVADGETPINYSVEILQGCGKDNGGSQVVISLQSFSNNETFAPESQTLEFQVKETGHWQNFEARSVGSLKLKSGKYRLTVKPKQKQNAAIMDLRELRLLPEKG